MLLLTLFQHETVHPHGDGHGIEFTTARKLIQKEHIAVTLLHRNMQETGPWWERCLFPALLWRPCMHSSVFRRTPLPRGYGCAASTHPHWGASFAAWGWQHVQGMKELRAPRNWICHHWGKLCAPTAHIVREMCLSVTFQVTNQTEFCYSTNNFTDCCVCMWVSPLTKSYTRDKTVCLLQIPLRSQEADRTEKQSLASHEVSYTNFTKLMDLSQGFWGMDPAQMRHQVSWSRCRTSSYRVCALRDSKVF